MYILVNIRMYCFSYLINNLLCNKFLLEKMKFSKKLMQNIPLDQVISNLRV